MTIEGYKTKDGQRYRAVFEFQGQRHKQRGFQTQREADAWIVDERRRLNSEMERSLCCHISDFSKKYFEAEASRISAQTLSYKMKYVQDFFAFLGKDTPIEDITREVAIAFQKYMLRTTNPINVNRYIRELRVLWNWHITNTGIVSSNPFKVPSLPESKYVPYIPPKEDIERVLDTAEGWIKDFLLLVLATAARRSEIRKLTWDDIDFQKKIIRLKTKKRRGGGEEWDNLPMNSIAESVLLRRHLEREGDGIAVFPPKYRTKKMTAFRHINTVSEILHKLCVKAGVKPFSFHPLRHYVASILRDKHQASLFEIQHVLRHKKPGTTAIYLDTLKTPVERPLNSLSDEFSAFL